MKVKHILSDGRVLDSIDGFRLPYTTTTAIAYRLLAEAMEGGEAVDCKTKKMRPTPQTSAAVG